MTRPEPTSDITPDTPSGVIAVQVPAAIPVFRRLWIDFCSSQPIPLVDAVTRAGANLDEVLGEILALPRERVEPDWSTAPIPDLLDHIIATHHEFTKNALPALWELLREVLGKHGDDHPELHEVAKVVAPLFTELGQHLQKEEQHLFPYLRQMTQEEHAPQRVPEAPMKMMEDEHDTAREAFHQLRAMTNEFRAPQDASDAYRSLYAGLAELGRDLFLHIHLENNILHARTREMCGAVSS